MRVVPLFVFTATLDHSAGSVARFFVEENGPDAAVGAVLSWLDLHASIRSHAGDWIRSNRVLLPPRAETVPAENLGAGSYLIDGRRVA
jgi:hypothetical protein